MSLNLTNRTLRESVGILSEYFSYEKGFKPAGGEGRLLVKFGSHRQRNNAMRYVLKGKRQGYYSLKRSTGKGVYEVTPEEIEELKKWRVKFTKFKDGDDLGRTWSMEDVMGLSRVNELLSGMKEELGGELMDEARDKRYRVTFVEKTFKKSNPAAYKYEFWTEDFGWRDLKNLSMRTKLFRKIENNAKLLGKEIKL